MFNSRSFRQQDKIDSYFQSKKAKTQVIGFKKSKFTATQYDEDELGSNQDQSLQSSRSYENLSQIKADIQKDENNFLQEQDDNVSEVECIYSQISKESSEEIAFIEYKTKLPIKHYPQLQRLQTTVKKNLLEQNKIILGANKKKNTSIQAFKEIVQNNEFLYNKIRLKLQKVKVQKIKTKQTTKLFKLYSIAIYFLKILMVNQKKKQQITKANPRKSIKMAIKISKPGDKQDQNIFPLKPDQMISVLWNVVMLILLLIVSIETPYRVCMLDSNDRQAVDWTQDILFFLDMIFNFICGYYDEDNNLILDRKMIIKRYLTSWFILDSIALFPFDLFFKALEEGDSGSSNQASTNRLLRLLRLPRLTKIAKLMNIQRSKFIKKMIADSGYFLKLFQILIILLYTNHLFACFWFLFAKLDSNPTNTWIYEYSQQDKSAFSKYITGYYLGIQTMVTVGFGDISPINNTERFILIIYMFMGVILYSYTIDNLSNILKQLDKEKQYLQQILGQFQDLANQYNIPDFLYEKAIAFYNLNYSSNNYLKIHPKQLLNEIPSQLGQEIILNSNQQIIENTLFFKLDFNFTYCMIHDLNYLQLKEGEILYREDDPSEELYIILYGKVDYIDQYNQTVMTFSQGDYFGEIELFNCSDRLCFARARGQSTILAYIKSEYLMQHLRNFFEIQREMMIIKQFREQVIQHHKKSPKDDGDMFCKEQKLMKSTEYYTRFLISFNPEIKAFLKNKENYNKKSSKSNYTTGNFIFRQMNGIMNRSNQVLPNNVKKKIGSIGRFSRSASKKETKVNGGVEGGAKSADNNKMGEHKQCASIVTNIFSESNDKLINQKKIE